MSVKELSLARLILGSLLLSLSPAGRAGATDASTGGQLVVYAEVPAAVTAETSLGISRVALRGESATYPLELLAERLDAAKLAGRQLRLVDQVVPPGFYEALEIEIDHFEASSGRAVVRPEVPEEPLIVPLDVQLMNGGSTLVVLRWIPAPVDPAAPIHRPGLEVVIPAVPPLGSIAFVSNEESGNLSIVSLASRRVVHVIRTGAGPRGMVYSRFRQRLYVADSGDNSLVVIDGPSLRRIKTTILNFGDEPSRLALSPDESQLYVLNWGSDVLSVLDAETLQEIARAYIGQEPRGMAVDATSGFVYVASELAPGIRVFDPARPEREISIPAGVSPAELVFDRAANRLHVAGAQQRILSVVSIEAQSVVERLSLCSPAVGLAYNPRSRRVYASLEDCRELVVLSPDVGLEIDSVRLDDPPGLLSFDPDYRELLVTSPSANEVLFYNVNSLQHVGTAAVGARPFLAVVPR